MLQPGRQMIMNELKVTSVALLLALCLPVPQARSDEPLDSNNSAVRLMQQGDYEKARALLQKTFNLFPYNEAVRKNLAAAHAAVGNRQLERKEFDNAAASFDQAVKLISDSRDYSTLRGIALYSGKRYDEAIIVLDQVRHSGGETPVVLNYLGRAYYDIGNLEGAIEAWETALTLEPANKAVREMAEKARREYAVESTMGKGYRSLFVISYDEGRGSDLAQNVLEALETAYNRVGSDLDYYPTASVPVILYTRKDYRSVTAGPEWSGGLYDGKVRLPIGGARQISPVMRGVLFHEYTHVVVGELTRRNCPTWLNEGLAEVEGRKEFDPPLTALEDAVRTGKLLPFASLEKSLLALNSKEAALAYQQSYSLVRYLISSYGWYKVREILVNLGNGMSIGAAVATAFVDYGLELQGIEKEWQESVRKEYGN